MTPISIGEIHVPGDAGLGTARCLMLTSPLQREDGLELFFAMFSADAPKRVLEKLIERLGEELRIVFFRPGDAEARFEAALKQANKALLAFLYEHGLSMPGIKLRGAAAAFADGRLFVSSRGAMRGVLYVPNGNALVSYPLFDETPEKGGEPKFFTSLQAGMFPEGGRFVIATSELFQALDDGYVRGLLGQQDFAKASRDLKAALRASQKPISVLSLSSLLPDSAPAANAAPSAKPARPKKTPAPERPAVPVLGPDIGETLARGLRAAVVLAGRGVATGAQGLWVLLMTLAKLPTRVPRLLIALARKEQRAQLVAECKAAPGRSIALIIDRLNRLPSHSRSRFFALLAIGVIFAHGVLFSIRHEARAHVAKAYAAQLAELERLHADFSSSMIYGNEIRSRELIAQMDAAAHALPEATEAQKKTKAAAASGVEKARDIFRRVTPIEHPDVFARTEPATEEKLSMAWFDGTLYLFSSASGRVRRFSADGTALEGATIDTLALGVTDAVPARTGFLLQGVSGALIYWNPETQETSVYETTGLAGKPMLYYQGRLYVADADGTVTRRPVATTTLGAPASVLGGAPAAPTSLATDGAVYLLYKDGSTRKYLKGASVQDYAPSVIDPAPANASQLWASADSDKIVFIDRGGDRAFAVDRTTGRLLAQYVAPEFKNLEAGAVDAGGRTLFLLNGAGTIYKLPLK